MVSTKIEHTPDAPTPKAKTVLAAENKRAAALLANELERAERGNPTERQLRKLLADLSERVIGERITASAVDAYFEEWLEGRRLAPSTLERYRKPLRDFVAFLGERGQAPIDRITPRDVDAFTGGRIKAGFSAVTVRTDRKALNGPFAAALRQGLIQTNPVARAEPMEATSEEKLPFTRPEVESLLRAAAGTEWETLTALGCFAGLRLGDGAALQWESVDLFKGEFVVRPQKNNQPGRKKRELRLPIAPRLLEHLKTLPTPHEGPLCPTLSKTRIGGTTGLSCQFHKLMEAVGIDPERVEGEGKGRAFNRKSYHSTRHFFSTELERAGVGEDLRMKLLGQTTRAVNVRYTHTEVATLARAVALI